MDRKINSIAYETVETSDGLLPLLTPMSEVAGRMSVQAAAHHLESPQGGAGLLLGGVPGTPAAKVTIIDTKVWAGNLYWTIAGKTYRGLSRFKTSSKTGDSFPAEKRTLPMARDAYAKYLGIPVTDIRLGLIIWPTGAKKLNTILFRSPGSPTVVDGSKLTAGRAGRLFGSRPADARIFTALAQLTK